MTTERGSAPVKVDRLMREIEDDVRRARRKRMLARGGAGDYRDPEIYEAVDVVLRRALEARDHDALLLPDFLNSEHDWQLTTHLRFSSHRPVIGPVLIFLKRRILLPITRWLYEYSLENFRRQQKLNLVLFACIEELAIENAKLRRGQEGRDGQEGQDGRNGQDGQESRGVRPPTREARSGEPRQSSPRTNASDGGPRSEEWKGTHRA